MDAAQWPQIKANTQGIGMEGSRGTTITDQRRTRPEKDKQDLNCPRCNSTNTKFCYYNNYSLSQPRYFCKGCRRYWTAGGSLRNVPVGGGSRKNKRSSSSSSPSPSSSKKQLLPHDLTPPNNFSSPNPKMINNQSHDLNLAYPPSSTSNYINSNSAPFSSSIYTSGFSLNFSLDGFGNSGYYENLQGVQETNARVFFPFEELKLEAPRSSTTDHHFEQNNIAVRGGEGDQASGYWSGMLGGGGGSSW